MSTSDTGTCGGCGTRAPINAVACPGCGEKFKKKSGRPIILVAIAIFIVAVVFLQQGPSNVADAKPSAPPLTSEQVAANALKSKQEDARLSGVIAAMRVVKKHLRDPDSLQWAEIGANDDGSVICMRYRAKNGFGGMNVEVASVAKNTLQIGAAAWKRDCTKSPLHDMSFAGT